MARAEWQVVQIDGRDYVTLASIAPFYGLGAPAATGPKKFTSSGGGRSIQVELGSREAMIDGVRHWLSFPARPGDGGACISRVDLSRTVDPALRPEKVAGLRAFRTVVLDAGHGGHDNGAASRFGYEKAFTLDTVRRLRKRLESAGLRVVQTRNSDTFIDLEARPRVANKTPASIFVSIHYNCADWKPSANGIETYSIPPLGAPPTGQDNVMARDRLPELGHALEPVNFTLANTMQHALVGKLGVEDRGVKRARYVVLKDAATPAILIEGGFLTNPGDAARIANPAWRESYAAAIAAGILEYKKLAEQGTKPREKKEW
ncbi:MAG: N-acetylmuramoyl-L-alanine amidase [Terrimicrobiaceae bacterium]|nr:N-acetylmuramoyl-L-alanine amidase [Terrimicrobiaceae bacterium]